MGLTVKEILNSGTHGTLTFDGTIPFTLVLNEHTESDVLHYELISQNDSFFEIELFKSNGEIKSIILVNANKKDIQDMGALDFNMENVTVVKGEPIIDVTLFNSNNNSDYFDRFHREHGFTISISKQGLSIVIDKTPITSYVQLLDHCFLGLSAENKLISFVIDGLDDVQLNTFRGVISD